MKKQRKQSLIKCEIPLGYQGMCNERTRTSDKQKKGKALKETISEFFTNLF